MNAIKTGRLRAAAVLMILPGMTSVCRAASPALTSERQVVVVTTGVSSKMTGPELPVVVKIGAAMLEEYRGGNPAARTKLFRGGAAAQAAPVKGPGSGTSHS